MYTNNWMLIIGLLLLLLATAISSSWPFYTSQFQNRSLFKDTNWLSATNNNWNAVKYQYDIDGDTYLSTINDPRNDKRYNNITLEAVENGPRFIHRITIVLLVYAIYLSLNVLYYYSILYIKDGIGIYNGLFQFSQINGTFEVFMLILSVIILSITSYNYSCKNHKYGTINYKDNDINIENNTENNTDDNINNNINTNNNNTEKEASLKSLGSSYIYNTINTKILTGHLSSVYPLLILLNLLGALMFMKNIDLISMYITIELQSFALYIISSINRNNQLSVKSGLTYFLLGGLSSTFILLGSALIYSSTCLTSLENIYIIHSLISNDFISQSWSSVLYLGICILICGYLFKIGSSPFHNWAPDVYDGVPYVITIWLQVMTKISILIFLLSLIYNLNIYLASNLVDSNISEDNLLVNYVSNLAYNEIYSYIILFSAILSLVIGTILSLVQYRIKRLLAYSTIAHLGFLLICLYLSSPILDIDTYASSSIESYLFYLIQYSLTSCNNLLIVMAFGYMYFYIKKYFNNKYDASESINNIIYIDDLKGSFWINPMLSLCLFISLFSLAGIPPQMGFFAKLMVILTTIEHGYLILAILLILMSVISASYYLRVMKIMYFDDQYIKLKNITHNVLLSNEININNNNNSYSQTNNFNFQFNNNNSDNIKVSEYFSNSISFWISFLTLIILLFCIKPSIILNWVHILTISLYYS